LLAVETGASRRYTEMRFRAGDALLFGPETGGLPAELLGRIGPDNVLAIPMQTASRSLNLSNAVALVIYEAWRQLDFAGAGGP
jgi:tRNA (cytidine/uridine-2'-O-)-methyltransferase